MEQIEQTMMQAVQHHQEGDLQKAEQGYRWVLSQAPGHPDAWHLLGLVHHQAGENEKAIECIQKAVNLQPKNAHFLLNLANVSKLNNNIEMAFSAFQKCIKADPANPQAHANFANLLTDMGNDNKAPNNPTLHSNISSLLINLHRIDEAVEHARKAESLAPNNLDYKLMAGVAYSEASNLTEATKCFLDLIKLEPSSAKGHAGLGGCFRNQGEIDKAVTYYKKALELDKSDHTIHSGLLMTVNYTDNLSRHEALALHKDYCSNVFPPKPKPLSSGVSPNWSQRPLRIGYLSPDFRSQSCAYFIMPLIKSHDRNKVKVYCYSTVTSPDQITEEFKSAADNWTNALTYTKKELAERIKKDGIDILVDLSAHTGSGGWLEVFSYRPAALQASWLGYPNTTGLDYIDYRLVDAITDPLPEAQEFATETIKHLPDGFLCFQPIRPTPSPQARDLDCPEPVTFGSFNNLNKVTDDVIAAWASVLNQVEVSQLLMKSKLFNDAAIIDLVQGKFEAHGVAKDRVECISATTAVDDHLSLYNRVDIALDTFPYNGTTTTCEALHMGVPVVAFLGDRHASRVSASILENTGYPELCGDTVEEYIEIAVCLGKDRSAQRRYKQELRHRMANAPISDAEGFAKKMENAFAEMMDARG